MVYVREISNDKAQTDFTRSEFCQGRRGSGGGEVVIIGRDEDKTIRWSVCESGVRVQVTGAVEKSREGARAPVTGAVEKTRKGVRAPVTGAVENERNEDVGGRTSLEVNSDQKRMWVEDERCQNQTIAK